VLSAIDPGVVLVPGWAETEALTALQWCGERQVPAIIMSESNEWDEHRVGWREWIKKRIVARASAVLVGGHPHANYLLSLDISTDRIFLGYDVVDNEYFYNGASKIRNQTTELRAKFRLPERYFLASARFVQKKNLLRLIEGYVRYRELVKAESGPWNLVILGEGPLRPILRAQLSTLNLHDSVLLLGFKQYAELPLYYGLASAFIHASTTEQWGLVVNEAMASGLPVLVSNRCGCAQDLVKEGFNGFTFDPFNVEELANLMFRLSHSTGASARMPSANLHIMGQASRSVIFEWGPRRFAAGLQASVDMALASPQPRASLLDKLLLRLLLMHS
jgi:glycosyltransferase involved in cell wall biosynthesis